MCSSLWPPQGLNGEGVGHRLPTRWGLVALAWIFIGILKISLFYFPDFPVFCVISLQINVWLSIISFHAYAEITFETAVDVSTCPLIDVVVYS